MFLVNIILSCKCANPPPEEIFCKANNVVYVSVVQNKTEEGIKIYTVAVERVLKGNNGSLRKAIILETSESTASCGIELKTGEKYLVIVEFKNGEMSATSCPNLEKLQPNEIDSLLQNAPDTKTCKKYSK
ncbi:Metalloproteinase inhibitor 3-like protein [Leptotrombidium deliense]|uniref:Metalloproteinase inhibitor 3-like protein n=1 Tax=Leptotrombidium deliense TaxID=299467 RepID=A0A443SH28_9ACAR|nr:Metalloproteinase inhibitor 3-like protein [Leptotrombidium deliense]